MPDPHVPIVFKEIWQPDGFVPLGAKQQQIVGPDLTRPIDHPPQLTSLAERANAPPLTLESQPI
tara:strand:- start:510 stop:701 length:192 start_codon:yes stop_codon:yes gene_type:complete